jgi:hypothetical protein
MQREFIEQLSIKEYFQYFIKNLDHSFNVEQLTNLFTDLAYSERTPYRTRRTLIPHDSRFSAIEIVYNKDKPTRVGSIVWELDISLYHLIDILGRPIVEKQPFVDSFLFSFKTNNPDVLTIQARKAIKGSSTFVNKIAEQQLDFFSDIQELKSEILDYIQLILVDD